MGGAVDLLGGHGGFGEGAVDSGGVVGVGLQRVSGVLFGLHGASGAAIGGLVGCGDQRRGRGGLLVGGHGCACWWM